MKDPVDAEIAEINEIGQQPPDLGVAFREQVRHSKVSKDGSE